MNTNFYFQSHEQAQEFSAELRKCFILSVANNCSVEIYNFALIKEECKSNVLGIARKVYEEVVNDLDAQVYFNNMSVEECVNYWNRHVSDFMNKIHETEDENYWDRMSRELGALNLVRAICDSNDFHECREYVCYIEDNGTFFSFSTKEQLLEYITEDWFIEELMNE